MKLKIFIFLVISLLLLSYLQGKLNIRNVYINNPIAKQKNYLVYYNKVNDEDLEILSKYDLAILEPANVEAEQLSLLKESKTLNYGYKSIFEIESYKKELVNSLKEEDYFYIDGIKQYNKHLDCYFGDIRSENYKEVLLKSIEKDIILKGFDGIFFDTLDDIEHWKSIDKELRKELYKEYMVFFELLKEKYPDLSIVQNRAFSFYNFGSARLIDGLMYEDLKYRDIETMKFYENLVNTLSDTAREYGVVILALSHEDAQDNYNLSKELNWLYHFNSIDNNYLKLEDNIYDIEIKR